MATNTEPATRQHPGHPDPPLPTLENANTATPTRLNTQKFVMLTTRYCGLVLRLQIPRGHPLFAHNAVMMSRPS
jgi:hypothetical protein